MIYNALTKIIRFLAPYLYAKELLFLNSVIYSLKSEFKRQDTFSLPQQLLRVLVVAEDRRFYSHSGVDFHAIFRAIRNNIIFCKFEGASTIQQQLTRVLINDYKLSYARKVKEIFLASTLLLNLTREEVLSLYLYRAYYGLNGNGLKEICKTLNYDLQKMSLYEAASIVARLKYPQSVLTNHRRNKQITRRTNYILFLYRKNVRHYKSLIKAENEIIYTQ